MFSSAGADSATAGILTAGAAPAGTAAALLGGVALVGAVRGDGEAGLPPAPIREGLTAARAFDLAGLGITAAVLRPAAQGVVPASAAQGRVGVVRRRPSAVQDLGQAGQGEARVADTARAEARVPAAAPGVAAADLGVAAVAADLEVAVVADPVGVAAPVGVVDPAALGAVAGTPAVGKHNE